MERLLYFKDNKVYGIYVTDSYFIKADLRFYCRRFSSPVNFTTNKQMLELFPSSFDTV
jgi:hypothetical protein